MKSGSSAAESKDVLSPHQTSEMQLSPALLAPKPLSEVELVAKSGNSAAQVELGRRYKIVENDEKAVEWFTKAVEQNDPAGQNELGLMLMEGRGIEKNEIRAHQLFESSAAQGNGEGHWNAGMLIMKRRLFDLYPVARDHLQKTNPERLSEAYYQCGLSYLAEWNPNYERAHSSFLQATRQNPIFAGAEYKLGHLYEHGRGVPKSNLEAAKCYFKAITNTQSSHQLTDHQKNWMRDFFFSSVCGYSENVSNSSSSSLPETKGLNSDAITFYAGASLATPHLLSENLDPSPENKPLISHHEKINEINRAFYALAERNPQRFIELLVDIPLEKRRSIIGRLNPSLAKAIEALITIPGIKPTVDEALPMLLLPINFLITEYAVLLSDKNPMERLSECFTHYCNALLDNLTKMKRDKIDENVFANHLCEKIKELKLRLSDGAQTKDAYLDAFRELLTTIDDCCKIATPSSPTKKVSHAFFLAVDVTHLTEPPIMDVLKLNVSECNKAALNTLSDSERNLIQHLRTTNIPGTASPESTSSSMMNRV